MAKIMVVTTSGQSPVVADPLKDAGHDVLVATGFQAAITLLAEASPDVLLADIRLDAFNGLHLVIRTRDRHPRMRSIVVGPDHDPVLAREAAACGATYAVFRFDDPQLLELVTAAASDTPRRWPRKRLPYPLHVRIANRPARVVDLSYGGVRLETGGAGNLPAPVEIVFADSGVAISGQTVWSQPGPVGSWWSGVEVSDLAPTALNEWRQLVDTATGAA